MMHSKLFIQESTYKRPRKPCMTTAAKQRETLTNTTISYIQKANSNQEDDADDELDLTFAGIAKQMRLHLDGSQRQRVLNKIQTLMGNCIDNVLEGLPLMAPPPPLKYHFGSCPWFIKILCSPRSNKKFPPKALLVVILWVSIKVDRTLSTIPVASASSVCR